MYFRIYRDGDARWRLRKVVMELYNAGDDMLLDRRRLFSFPLFMFQWRLSFWKKRSLRCGRMMLDAMQEDGP